ncbi:DNA polymerase [Oscillospiraceae bacterium PP1C4]
MNRIAEALETNGIGFNWTKYEQGVLQDKKQQLEQNVSELCQLLNCQSDNIIDPKQLIWKLYKINLFPESLSFDFLKAHRHHSVYDLLYRYKRTLQFINQYGDKLFQQIQPDGRIHANWTMDGAKTGRMSSKEPNLQAFPGEIKPYFRPKKDYCFVSGDYSQIELRVLAELSQDSNMIQSFISDIDIHIKTASVVFNKPIEQISEEERTIGKRVNFGVCYGISAKGLCETVNKKTNVNLSFQQADKIKLNFYNAYPKILNYHNFLLKTDTIVSLGGRQWIDYPKGIARVNLPVQASAAEGLKIALTILMECLPDDCLLVNVIHDEIILEVPIPKAEQIQILLEQSMITGMKQLVKSVPIVVDTNIIF